MALMQEKGLERASNIAVIVVAVVVVFTLLHREFHSSNPSQASLKGTHFSLSTVTTAPSKVNLVLGIFTVCHFCEQNVGFYQQLSQLEAPGKLAFYTVFPQNTADANAFLNQKAIHPNGVVSSPLSKYKITGTPTLLLVDASGKVQEAWVGALDAARQAEVVQTIRKYE